MLGSTAYNNLF